MLVFPAFQTYWVLNVILELSFAISPAANGVLGAFGMGTGSQFIFHRESERTVTFIFVCTRETEKADDTNYYFYLYIGQISRYHVGSGRQTLGSHCRMLSLGNPNVPVTDADIERLKEFYYHVLFVASLGLVRSG